MDESNTAAVEPKLDDAEISHYNRGSWYITSVVSRKKIRLRTCRRARMWCSMVVLVELMQVAFEHCVNWLQLSCMWQQTTSNYSLQRRESGRKYPVNFTHKCVYMCVNFATAFCQLSDERLCYVVTFVNLELVKLGTSNFICWEIQCSTRACMIQKPDSKCTQSHVTSLNFEF